MFSRSVCIIGGGIVGAFLFNELSLMGEHPVLVERGEDVSLGATKANSGILHAGYDCEVGSKKAKYNVEGLKMYRAVAKRLGEKIVNCGSLVVGDKDSKPRLEELLSRGKKNGVKHMSILPRIDLLNLEPNLADEVEWGLYAKDACIISPYHFCVSLCEEAVLNGGDLRLNFRPIKIFKVPREIIDRLSPDTFFHHLSYIQKRYEDEPLYDFCYVVISTRSYVICDSIINCAGASINDVSRLLLERLFPTKFVKGEYILLDKSEGNLVHRPIFPLPDKNGKGILACPTVHGNVFFGPTATETTAGDVSVTSEGIAKIKSNAVKLVKNINFKKAIKLYAGLRVKTGDDFELYYSKENRGFITLAGICSPGLTSAPAIAHEVVEYLQKIDVVGNIYRRRIQSERKLVKRKPYTNIFELSPERREKLIERNGDYGEIVCNCEKITKGEVLDVLKKSPIQPLTTDGIKRRLRATMGHCQGSFCYGKLVKIMADYYKVDESEIFARGETSVITGDIKSGGIYEVSNCENTRRKRKARNINCKK